MDRGKILVLDDDPVVALSCKRVLRAEGFDISTVDRGRGALSLIEREHFDLLISDIRLPDIDGISILSRAATTHPDMDVVMITGYPTLKDAKECIRLGAVDYIEKPFTPDLLVNVVNRAFDRKGLVLKKELAEDYSDYIVHHGDAGVIGYPEGVWARALGDGLWEVGCDVRYRLLGGELVYIEFIKKADAIKAGEPFARILASSGRITDLPMPMTAHVKDVNADINDIVVAMFGRMSEGWLLKLAKVSPVSLT
ncbi:MAG: response regulator [Thermodesulfovibrionales bacterium]|nr:response regulator [Thermodesulfovibrionales bacterium]